MTEQATTRGIDHIGLTVPDIDAATEFFRAAFGARIVYDIVDKSTPGLPVDDAGGVNLAPILGVKSGTVMRAFRMMRIGNSANIEMFEWDHVDQQASAAPTDFGWQHVAFYVDDIRATSEKVIAAGGTPLVGPIPAQAAEAGEGNEFLYFSTPWGSMVELVTSPSPALYEASTDERRWKPEA